jgi:hypothetical protein
MKFQRQNYSKKISPSRQRRNLKRLRERLAEAKSQLDKAIARRGARKRIKNNTQINEGKSQIIPIIDLVNNSDSEIEYNTNCTVVSFDDEVEDITDCRILGSSEERALRRRSLRMKEDARVKEQARMQAKDDDEYSNFMNAMEQQQRENGNILLPRPPKEWEERERTWRDSWTYSPHVISANELMRIAHAGRAVERQRVIDSQASFRQFAQDWRNRSISRAA